MNFKNILSLFACLLVSNHFISQDSNQEIKSILIKDLIKTPKKLSKGKKEQGIDMIKEDIIKLLKNG
jgi:hypothetical protein